MNCLAGVQGVDRVDCQDVKTSFPRHGNNTSKLSWLAQIHQSHRALLWTILSLAPFPSQNEYLKIQSWSVEWILDEEPDIERMHCQASDHNTKASPHKRSPKMIFYQSGDPGFVRFLLFGGKLSFLARTSQPTFYPSVKSSRSPQILPTPKYCHC